MTSPGSCFAVLVDSSVAKSFSAKGRSTSLRRAMAHQNGFELYPAFAFAPARLRVPLRSPSEKALCRVLPLPVLHNLASLRLRRPVASWARLLLVLLVSKTGLSDVFLRSLAGRFSPLLSDGPRVPGLDFDATLGYPGEGPSSALLGALGVVPLGHLLFCLGPQAGGHLSGFSVGGASFPSPSFPCGLFCLGFLPPVSSFRVEPLSCLLPACCTSPDWTRLDLDSSVGFPGEVGSFCSGCSGF